MLDFTDFVLHYLENPILLGLTLSLSSYGLYQLLNQTRVRLPHRLLSLDASKQQLAHHQRIKELTSMLLVQSSRLIDGDYAESSFLYHIWRAHGGNQDKLKDYELRRAIEKAQMNLKAIYTSYNNLTIANPTLRQAHLAKLGHRWEMLFLWLRGVSPNLLRLSKDELEDLFSVEDIPSEHPLAAINKLQDDQAGYLDVQFHFLKSKEIKPYQKGLLDEIWAIKKQVEQQVKNSH